MWQSPAMLSLRWQVWSGPVLLVANPPLFQEVRRSLQSSSGKCPELVALAPNRLRPSDREPGEGSMTFRQISKRGNQYLKTAETLIRAAQTMTDLAIAGQLKALADDYQLRKPRMLMRPKHSLDRLLTLKTSGVHDLMGSITAQPA